MKMRRSVTLDPEVWKAATSQARRLDRSFSWLTQTALRHYLKTLQSPKKGRKTDVRKLEATADLSA
jgi:predicted transcriptional regulator